MSENVFLDWYTDEPVVMDMDKLEELNTFLYDEKNVDILGSWYHSVIVYDSETEEIDIYPQYSIDDTGALEVVAHLLSRTIKSGKFVIDVVDIDNNIHWGYIIESDKVIYSEAQLIPKSIVSVRKIASQDTGFVSIYSEDGWEYGYAKDNCKQLALVRRIKNEKV